jgi:hypothetical protein
MTLRCRTGLDPVSFSKKIAFRLFQKQLAYSQMLTRVNVVQVCDARDDDSSTAAGYQNTHPHTKSFRSAIMDF